MKMKYNVHLYNKLANAFLKRGKLYLSPSYCGAQGNSFVFDPFGYIYSCLEIIGDKEKAIGNYFNGIVWYPEKDMWFNRNIGNVENCRLVIA